MVDEEPTDNELSVLNEIFVKAAQDPAFRKELLDNPDEILAKYNLSDNAKQSILDALKGSL
ncbi:MAG: hypothetical protein D6752_04855 [Candidatus Nitrosothermus koennekii]|jgi:uncharacterized protein YihD (DUF1040 family)|nr:MAG: hypothetical protein D6752_04855 [Candidatus Nitrosothermus koennekii]